MVAYPMALHSALLHRGNSQRIGCKFFALGLTLHNSYDLFSIIE